jgi:hypothetical protein
MGDMYDFHNHVEQSRARVVTSIADLDNQGVIVASLNVSHCDPGFPAGPYPPRPLLRS